MTFTVTPGTTYSATSPVTSTNLNAHVSALTIAGITNTQIDTAAAALVQIISGDGGATTTEGAPLWNKTTDKFGISDGTSWVNHVQGEAQATLPRTITNYMWFDTTLGIQRIYIARNGLTGFHPIENGYLLVNNESGSNLAAGDVVVDDWATGVNHVKATTVKKDQTVRGVCLEAINTGSSGIIATYGCPKNITVNIDETDGALAVGDGIVSYSATNRGRTVGALPTTVGSGSGNRFIGVPLGCFAVALSTVTANAATARMLPQIGTGCHRTKDQGSTVGSVSTSATDATATITPASAKHSPLFLADIKLLLAGDAGGTGDTYDVDVVLETDTSGNTFVGFSFVGQAGTSGAYEASVSTLVATVDDPASPTATGDKFNMRFVDNGGDVSTTLTAQCFGYYY